MRNFSVVSEIELGLRLNFTCVYMCVCVCVCCEYEFKCASVCVLTRMYGSTKNKNFIFLSVDIILVASILIQSAQRHQDLINRRTLS